MINPRPLNRTGFYSKETSIQGNTVYIYSCAVMAGHIQLYMWQDLRKTCQISYLIITW